MTERELLLTAVRRCRRVDLYADPRPLTPPETVEFERLVGRLAANEPVQYILKSCEFMGLSFFVDERVLIPRPETEILVETVLHRLRARVKDDLNILDIGTGSGNIAIALAKHLDNARLFASDVSAAALDVAKDNARALGVEGRVRFVPSDVFEGLNNEISFDVIVSNPPYIPSREMGQLPRDVQREPRLALDGGRDGLDLYRRIIRESPPHLRNGSLVFFEIGQGQEDMIGRLFNADARFHILEIVKDYRKINRIIVGEYHHG